MLHLISALQSIKRHWGDPEKEAQPFVNKVATMIETCAKFCSEYTGTFLIIECVLLITREDIHPFIANYLLIFSQDHEIPNFVCLTLQSTSNNKKFRYLHNKQTHEVDIYPLEMAN